MDEHPRPQRSGIAKNITLTRSACELLDELVPSPKTCGQFISMLIEAEHVRRTERARARQQLRAALDRSA